MLNIAFLLASTGLPSPAEITWVVGLSTFTAGSTVTSGWAANLPLTDRPSIVSPMSTSDFVAPSEESPPQAAVVSSIRVAMRRASRRRTMTGHLGGGRGKSLGHDSG